MAKKETTVIAKVDDAFKLRVANQAIAEGTSESTIVRKALLLYLSQVGEQCQTSPELSSCSSSGS